MNILKLLNNLYLKYIKSGSYDIEQIFYIAGSQTLPPPLEPKEEEEILKRLIKKDNEARQILVERNLRLVVYIAKKFENTRNRNRRLNINWNNWTYESNKYI